MHRRCCAVCWMEPYCWCVVVDVLLDKPDGSAFDVERGLTCFGNLFTAPRAWKRACGFFACLSRMVRSTVASTWLADSLLDIGLTTGNCFLRRTSFKQFVQPTL